MKTSLIKEIIIMADKYDYSTDSTTNKHEIRRRATKIFFSCGLPLVIIFAPELIELYFAGHNVAMFFIGLGLYILWAAVFLIFIARPIRKNVYGVKSQDFRIEGLILLFVLIAALTAYARYKLGWYLTF